ncbi:hypothetical protein DL98DRAFT_532771 [Cadophora sp. DSE1049]|nr:hypothetical protein DL98DRAFT_532771 [Cadophora sp. DSE1049]
MVPTYPMRKRDGRKPFGATADWGFCRSHNPGWEQDPRYKREKPVAVITILHNPDGGPDSAPSDRIKTYLETLCHDILHLHLYLQSRMSRSAYRRHGRSVESLVGDIQSGFPLTNDIMPRSANLDIVQILKHLQSQHAIKAAEEPYRNPTMTPYKPLKRSSCIRDEQTVDEWEKYFGFDRRMWRRSGIPSELHVRWTPEDEWRFGNEYIAARQCEVYERHLGPK